jgi:hypothetical protein
VTWAEFYNQIRDPAWPECPQESDFHNLPEHIKQECQEVFGYVPDSFKKQSKLVNRRFPIVTETACQLKWNWSTVFLTTGETASCHRTDHHQFDIDQFDFHNTPSKLQDRRLMLKGKWPERGCDYCRNIEQAGGQSDRITNLDFPGIHAPPELDQDPSAVHVTPRILEVYFDNTCNLKCVYCGPYFSSLWDAENVKFGGPAFVKDANLETNKQRIFDWLRINGHHLTVLNVLGGEPLYQRELDQVLDLIEHHPMPELKLQMFSNLNAKPERLESIVNKIRRLVDLDHLREFEITASLDCWGEPQEYARFPLKLDTWEKNFEYLVEQPWINLIVSSTVTPLTVKTLPDLLERINQWSQRRPIYHYQNSVNGPSYMFIDIFGNIFDEDFQRALALKPQDNKEQQASRNYLAGIAQQCASAQPNVLEIRRLFEFLNRIDSRRSTNWAQVYPWLVPEFARYGLTI